MRCELGPTGSGRIEFGMGQICALKAMMIRDMPDQDFLARNPGDQPYADRVLKAVGKLNEASEILKGDDDEMG